MKELNPLAEEKLKEFFDWLVRNNIVESGSAVHVGRFEDAQRRKRKQQTTQLFNPFYFRIPLFRPDAALQKMLPLGGCIFSRVGIAVWLLLMVVAAWQLLHHYEQFQTSAVGIFSGWQWLWLVVAGLALKVVHECGHGLASKKFGADVRETGVVLMCFMPLAYIDVTSCWRLPNKWQRIAVSLAGMFVESMVAALALIAWTFCPDTVAGDICCNIALMASITTLLFNANPLMRFDGYYAMSDLLEAPNLYARAGQMVNQTIGDFFLGAKPGDRRWNAAKITLLVYGLLTLWWRVMICIGLALVASFMFYGAGIVLAVIGVFFWTVAPLKRSIQTIRNATKHRRIELSRVALAVLVLAACGLMSFSWMSRSAIVYAWGVVEYAPLTVVRAEGPGFMREICVDSGQYVQAGETIAILENAELAAGLQRLKYELAQSETRTRDLQQRHEHSLGQAEDRSSEALREQIAQLQHQLDSLTVKAPHEGSVIRRNLEQLNNTYFEEGDEIVVIGCETQKELRVSIDQSDVVCLRADEQASSHNHRVTVMAYGHSPFQTEIVQIDPRGSRTPLHPSLCANHGGSLPVRRNPDASSGEEAVELLSPGFTGTIKLTPEISERLAAGKRVQVSARTSEKTRGVQYYEDLRNWWRTQIFNASQTSNN